MCIPDQPGQSCGPLARWVAVMSLVTAAFAGPTLEAHAADHAALFHEIRFDFGSSVQGTLIEHDFLVTNEGTTPLRIGKVALTPPLLATRIPGEIAPGASAAIHTQLDTSQLQGSFSGELVVHARDDDAQLATLAFEGVVVTPIEIAPMPAFFVVGQRGRGAELALDLINHEAQPLRIEGVAHSTEAFTTRLETVEPGQRYRLILNLRPDGPGGRRKEVITLRTSSAATPTLRIPAHTYLRERVYAFPGAVDLGALTLSAIRNRPDLLEATAQTLMIYQSGGSDFLISVESDLPNLVLSSERGPQKDRYEITVRMNASQISAGPLQGSIRIRTNDPQFPELVVPVAGLVLDR
jgi:Protein of unknown function (DUF1573)